MPKKSKYRRAELRHMAVAVLRGLEGGDSRSKLVVVAMQARTGMPPHEIVSKITELSK